jgi:hypothetical protein
MARVVVLTEGLLNSLAKQAKFYEPFPFIRNTPRVRKHCYCGGARVWVSTIDDTAIKKMIADMPAAAKEKFKKLLDAPVVKVILPDRSGTPRIVLF